MSESQVNSVANRLAELRVGVRNDLKVTRHVVQGSPTYTIHDPIRFASHHLDAGDYQVLVSLTKHRPLARAFDKLVTEGILSAKQEAEFYDFVVYLNQIGLLDLPVLDGRSLYERFQKRAQRRRWRLSSLLFFRVPLIQPDAFLDRTIRFVAPLFTRTALVLWGCCVFFCLWLISHSWQEFAAPLSSMVTTANLPLLVCLLIGLKVIHEFGHAYACKRFGGTVPEMGAFFLVMTPCAYVDASAAWSFRQRRHRIAVSLAGVYFESMVAMAALLYWFFAETSSWRSFAQYTFVLSSLVTVAFNINPLMRYDGYYVLVDLLDLPNLRREAWQQVAALAKWLLYGVPMPRSNYSHKARVWLLTYGVASNVYRVVVILGIMMFVILRFPLLGTMLSVSCVAVAVVTRLKALCMYVRHSEELSTNRLRAVLATTTLFSVAFVLIFVIRFPRTVVAVGVLERSHDVVLRVATPGFMTRADHRDGEAIDQGEVVCRLSNDPLEARLAAQRAQVKMLAIASLEAVHDDGEVAAIADRRRASGVKELNRLEEMERQLAIRSSRTGELVETWRMREEGKYFRKGEPVARVTAGQWIMRVVATEDEFARSKLHIGRNIKLRIAGAGLESFEGTLVSISDSASTVVPDAHRTHWAGGPIKAETETSLARKPHIELKVEFSGDQLPKGALYGMSGIAMLPGKPESVGVEVYRVALRFLYQLRQTA